MFDECVPLLSQEMLKYLLSQYVKWMRWVCLFPTSSLSFVCVSSSCSSQEVSMLIGGNSLVSAGAHGSTLSRASVQSPGSRPRCTLMWTGMLMPGRHPDQLNQNLWSKTQTSVFLKGPCNVRSRLRTTDLTPGWRSEGWMCGFICPESKHPKLGGSFYNPTADLSLTKGSHMADSHMNTHSISLENQSRAD